MDFTLEDLRKRPKVNSGDWVTCQHCEEGIHTMVPLTCLMDLKPLFPSPVQVLVTFCQANPEMFIIAAIDGHMVYRDKCLMNMRENEDA